MAVVAYEHRYWAFAWVPIFGAFIWFGTLLSMLIAWLATGRPKYVTQQGSIAYISDIGASYLKPLFIVCCCITGVSFFLALVCERWLRHSGRLVPNMRRRERALSSMAILGSFIGGAGLILLSIFDTGRHPSLHRVFLLVFIVGVGLSAIFTILEYRWISHDFVEIRKLKRAYIAKGVIAILLILCAIAFAIALYQAPNVGAILEWVIAFGYTFYLLTFFYDLRMARGVHKGELSEQRLLSMQQNGGNGVAMQEANAAGGNGRFPNFGRFGRPVANDRGANTYSNGLV
ncbi:Frag1/DRAM/Sfk1 family-domain-containing protein [Amylocystis lapponica]|nr:Frag1/DRAM/Sfk1 family-domain-containing protein [Amylocystis lapponica]